MTNTGILTTSVKENRACTVGDKVIDLMNKPAEKAKVLDLTQWQLGELNKGFEECYAKAMQYARGRTFFMWSWVKLERIFSGKVLHVYFYSRWSCPTPQYDQTVFICRPNSDPEFLWTLPDKFTYQEYVAHPELVPSTKWNLLKHVLADKNGELLRLTKKLNGEPEN